MFGSREKIPYAEEVTGPENATTGIIRKEPLYKPSFSRIGTMSTHWSTFCSLSLLDQWSGCMEG